MLAAAIKTDLFYLLNIYIYIYIYVCVCVYLLKNILLLYYIYMYIYVVTYIRSSCVIRNSYEFELPFL
jgi:hypothetical protein